MLKTVDSLPACIVLIVKCIHTSVLAFVRGICNILIFHRDVSASILLQEHRARVLQSQDDVQRIIIRRKHVWEDTMRKLKGGLEVNKPIKVSFVGETAVDEGGPLREYLSILITSMACNNNLFQGDMQRRLPRPNLLELDKKSYYYVGMCIAMTFVHGGPNPAFFSPSTAKYIVSGKISPSLDDVPDEDLKHKLYKVWTCSDTLLLYTVLLWQFYDIVYNTYAVCLLLAF